MKDLVIKPEDSLKRLWQLIAGFLFTIALLVIIVMNVLGFPLFPAGLLFLCWLVLAIPTFIYIPAFYKTLEYTVDADAVRLKKGVFWRKNTTVPYAKITNIDLTQGPLERMFNIGKIHVQTAGAGGQQGAQAELVIVGIRDFHALRDTIMDNVRGFNATGKSVAGPAPETGSDNELLQAMLTELKAIRIALDKK